MTQKIKRLCTIAVSLFIVTLGIVAIDATPAAAGYATCPVGVSCLYSGTNGTGSQTNFPFSTYHDNKCHNLTFHPVGGYHSGIGGYGSGYRLTIFHDTGCRFNLYDLSYGATFSSPETIDSILVTHA